MRKPIATVLFAAFVVCFFAVSAFAALTGNITGTVFDPSGAVVPNAKITITNTGTGAVRVISTGASGEFSAPQMDVGTYRVSVDQTGFKTYSETVIVRTGETTSIRVQMQVGSAGQTVTVEATATPNLDVTTAQVSDSLNAQQVIDLPNQGRDPVLFSLLSPGMSPSQNNGFLGTGDYNSNGSRGRANNITVDGVTADDISTTGESGLPMIPDTVQEFKIITNNFDAEFGRNSGSQVEVLTKSGTNSYHGSAYWYAQNTDFGNAASFNFLPSPSNPSSVSPIIQNQGGVTFGAPIYKDHTFFYGNWEVDRTRAASPPVVAVVLTPAQAGGITDPTALKLFKQDGSPTSPTGTLLQSAPNLTNADVWSIRIDQNLRGGKDTLYVKYGQNPLTTTIGDNFINTNLAGFGTIQKSEARDLSLGYTSALSNNWINTFNFGFGRSNPSFQVNSPFPVGPQINFGDGTSGFGESDIIPQGRTQNTFQYADKLSWVTGRHTIKFGVDFNRYQAPSFFPALANGNITFASIADFQAGNAAFYQQFIGPTTLHNFAFDAFGFAQDDFRVTPTLTLNLGVRLESSGGVSELRGLLSNLDLNNHQPLGALGFGPLGGIDLGGTAFNRTYNPAPRLGFAWNPNGGKLVVRGGYGIAYDFIYENPITNLRFSPPFVNTVTILGPAASGPGDSLANLVAGTAPSQAAATAAIGHFNPNQFDFGASSPVAQNLQNPRNQQYDLGVEYQIQPNMTLKATYVGAHNDRLQVSQPINPVNPADIPAPATSLADQNARLSQFQNTFINESGPAFGPGTNNRIDPRFDSVVQVQSTGTSSYNSLQLEAIRRFSNGLTFDTNYTWSHSLDDVSDALGVLNFDSAALLDPTKPLSFNRANSAFDVRNRFVLSYVYELPYHFHGALKYLLDGWGQSSVFTAQSGSPVTLPAAPIGGITDLLLDGDSNVSLDGNAAAVHPVPFSANFVEPANLPVSEPLLGHDGTSGRNQLYLNGLFNLDVTFMKNINITESKYFQLRWEIYNSLNHPVFGGAGGFITSINSPNFGNYVATANTARQMQLALKFIF